MQGIPFNGDKGLPIVGITLLSNATLVFDKGLFRVLGSLSLNIRIIKKAEENLFRFFYLSVNRQQLSYDYPIL